MKSRSRARPTRRSTTELPTNGRQRLIDAALRLAARHGGMGAVGVRELAREAGLNPNTLYRHFSDVSDLGVAAVANVLPALREGLRQMQRPTGAVGQTTRTALRYFFDFVARDPDAITFAARELHGALPKLREALREAVRGLTDDVVTGLRNASPRPIDPDAVRELADTIIKQMFELALEYVAYPWRRAEIVARAERFVLTLFVGSYVIRTMNLSLDSPQLDQALGLAGAPTSAPAAAPFKAKEQQR